MENTDHGQSDGPLADDAGGLRAGGRQTLHLPDDAGRRPGRHNSLPVLEVKPNERLSYARKGGHEGNAGYGSPLNTVVTFILSEVEAGTRLRLIHSGFVLPENETAFQKMGEGWKKVVKNIGAIVDETD
ncbi:SRPBCC domain-containing protein [Rhizobium leguminosarum bv. viciae]|nr:SRPBCC domain-containing protein [Rhizobium leguminosarum bv. viciae]